MPKCSKEFEGLHLGVLVQQKVGIHVHTRRYTYIHTQITKESFFAGNGASWAAAALLSRLCLPAWAPAGLPAAIRRRNSHFYDSWHLRLAGWVVYVLFGFKQEVFLVQPSCTELAVGPRQGDPPQLARAWLTRASSPVSEFSWTRNSSWLHCLCTHCCIGRSPHNKWFSRILLKMISLCSLELNRATFTHLDFVTGNFKTSAPSSESAFQVLKSESKPREIYWCVPLVQGL